MTDDKKNARLTVDNSNKEVREIHIESGMTRLDVDYFSRTGEIRFGTYVHDGEGLEYFPIIRCDAGEFIAALRGVGVI